MARPRGRVAFLWVCGHWWVAHAPADGPISMYRQAAQIGLSALLIKKKDGAGEMTPWLRILVALAEDLV